VERPLIHRTFTEFWDAYESLPLEVQRFADLAFAMLRENPRHPGLQFKKVGRFYSARIGLHYRALAIERNGDFYWFWIGHHNEYDKLLR
jgi:hypothetical protein